MGENNKTFKGLIGYMNKKQKRNLLLSCIAIIFVLALLVFFENGSVLDVYGMRVLNLCAIYAILGMALNLVQGFTGQFSLGSAGFMAVGAYTTVLLSLAPSAKETVFYLEPIVPWLANVQLPFFIALLIGGILTALIAFLIGFPVLRLKGDYLSVATLGFSEIIRILFVNMQSVTNGATGIKNIPETVNLWWTFGTLAIFVIVMFRLIKGSYGRSFKAIRDDEVAAEAMGISLFKHKMLSFVTYAFITGIAGGLLASVMSAITPTLFRYLISYDILLIMVMGGTGSITGSLVGGFLFIFAKEALRFIDNVSFPGVGQLPGLRMVIFSVLLMIIVLFYRKGLMGGKEFSWAGLLNFFRYLPRRIAAIFRKKGTIEGGAKK